jgi:VanZ family protein
MPKSIFNYSLLSIIILCFILLFFGGPNYYSSRSYQHAWDLGHILFFFLLTLLFLKRSGKFSNLPFFRQFLYTSILVTMVSILLEYAQTFFNRSAEYGDMERNLIGSWTALVFFSTAINKFVKSIKILLRSSVLILICFELLPVGVSLADEFQAKQQFPLLSDFETAFEKSRWEEIASEISINNEIFREGNHSLKIVLSSKKYSGVALHYFPKNWVGYKTLSFYIFNPMQDTLLINCRIHDEQHIRNGQDYYDRFNTVFHIPNGWSRLEIPLERVINGPRGRQIDIKNIGGFGIFVMDLPEPRIIYLDEIKLNK